jgi:orotate phosphoribosyltransferase
MTHPTECVPSISRDARNTASSPSPDRYEEDGLDVLRERVVEVVREHGLRQFPEPLKLASGEMSCDFVDGKAALAHGEDLSDACRLMVETLSREGIQFDAVGGLTMGADQFAHGVALITGRNWFVVRKEAKNRGTNKLIEGSDIGRGTRVLLVDDVVTTGGSIQRAYEAIFAAGGDVVAASALVDRGDVARKFFEDRDIPYFPLVTYGDLGIAPVGGGFAVR